MNMLAEKKKRKVIDHVLQCEQKKRITPVSSSSDLQEKLLQPSPQQQLTTTTTTTTTTLARSHHHPGRRQEAPVLPLHTLPCCDSKSVNWDGSLKVPYPVIYKCSKCTRKYYYIVQDNPWFTILSHPCPSCKIIQIPTIDIGVPQNARELDPNMRILYDEVFDEEFIDLTKAGNIPLYLDEAVLVALFPTEPSIQKATTEKNHLPKSLLEKENNINFRLLALILHTKSCDGLHSSAKEHDLCYNVKVLLLHIQRCESCSCNFPFCMEGRKILYYLSFFPAAF